MAPCQNQNLAVFPSFKTTANLTVSHIVTGHYSKGFGGTQLLFSPGVGKQLASRGKVFFRE